MKQNSKFRSFIIYPQILKLWKITANQYMCYESVRYLSTHNPAFNWCITKNSEMANFVCMSERGFEKAIKKGIRIGIIEKNPKEKWGIRTTEQWNSNIFFKTGTKSDKQEQSPNLGTKSDKQEQSSQYKVSDKVSDNSGASSAGSPPNEYKIIESVITAFSSVNPSYAKFFSNNTQRDAIKRLLKIYGEEKLKKMILSLPQIIYRKFAPKITTPLELENNLGKLVAYIKQEQDHKTKYQIEVLEYPDGTKYEINNE